LVLIGKVPIKIKEPPMLAILIVAAATMSAATPATVAASPATASVQCRVTIETAGPRYQVRCPAMPISPIADRARTEGASGARSDPSRGR
jgi:hypothetical protein